MREENYVGMTIPRPIVPREHGAWAVLFVPMVVAASIVQKVNVDLLLLASASLCVFLSYVPAQVLLRHCTGQNQQAEKLHQSKFWISTYALLAVSLLTPLLLRGHVLILPIGAAALASFLANFLLTRQNPKTISADLVSVCGLTLSALSAYYVLTGVLDWQGIYIWLMNVLFFGSSVFYVHTKIHASALKKEELSFSEKMSIGKPTLVYHFFVLITVGLLALTSYTPQFSIIAFVPMTLHALYGTLKLSSRVQFKKLGFVLVGQSIAFAILMMVTK